MRAVMAEQYGGPEVLHLTEVTEPRPGPGEVTVRVEAAAVGLIDVLFRRDGLNGLVGVPFIPGIEVAGRIAEVGLGVGGWVPGQRVVTMSRPGTAGYAEVVVVPVNVVLPLGPEDGIQAETAVATVPNTVTALAALGEAARLRAGERVLVLGATGGLAGVFPAVAHMLGAGEVVGAVSRAASIQDARALGYDDVVLIENLSGSQAWFDVVVDPIGGPLRATALSLLRPLGRLMAVGNASDADQLMVGTTDIWLNNVGVVGLNIAALIEAEPERVQALAARAVELVRSGEVLVPVEAVPLHAAADAHRRLENREVRGRIVLTPSPIAGVIDGAPAAAPGSRAGTRSSP
ncbi:zinc-binding alcohol dehydrogenase family protein [Leifsonia sp. NPDC014704]|uniref:quinone oxidoreductase family protein n=1 Tax=Leifsonia sp. NPDC014704 TaxID=3364123 RepID=UPI0036F46368